MFRKHCAGQPARRAMAGAWKGALAALLLVPALAACGGAAVDADAGAAASSSAAAASSRAAAASAEASASAAEASRAAAESKAAAESEAAAKREAEEQRKAQARAAAERKQRIENAEPVSARDLALLVKDPDAHADETIVVYGEITQFDSATGQCNFRANIAHQNMADTWDYEHNSIFTAGDGDTDCPVLDDFVTEDEVEVTVTVIGSYSYDTQIGGNTTVPAFEVEKIRLLG